MYKLILKVNECRRSADGFDFTCKDKYNIEYMFKSKCFKQSDKYIQVSFNKYNIIAGNLATAEQIELREVKYIDELTVVNNRLTLSGKPVQYNILKEVQKHVTRYTIKELENLIKECNDRYTYSDHLDISRKYEAEAKRYEQELKRLKRFLKVA